ncbi:MAG: DUF6765 family protein [Pseudomonadota bacterium]
MQKDMHYYGTYAMARAAGMTRAAAGVVATAAQYVDDNVARTPVVFRDGARLIRRPTAHSIYDVARNVNFDDQRDVWLPFHFLPGGDGADYTERLRCRKDSESARSMRDTVLTGLEGDVNALERLGITAHVYADTFSHHGFSGVSSRKNLVDGDSFTFQPDEDMVLLMREKGRKFFAKYGVQGGLFDNVKAWAGFAAVGIGAAAVKSMIGEVGAGALGHGGVATYPDQPYLQWSFTYQADRTVVERDNPTDFHDGCRALYEMFSQAAAIRDFGDGGGRPWSEIADRVWTILSGVVGPEEVRSQAWQDAARAGELFAEKEEIPPYAGDAWTAWLEDAHGLDYEAALDHSACRFHMAANAHRSWVQYVLMPSRNLLVA